MIVTNSGKPKAKFLPAIYFDSSVLIGVLAVGGIVYLILSYFNKGFDGRDRKIFNEAIGKNIFVF